MFSGNCRQSESEWSAFVAELSNPKSKNGDRVAVQVFHPHETGIFDNSMQYWEIHEGLYWVDKRGHHTVEYQGEFRSVKDGTLRYGDSASTEWGDVFPARVVKWSPEFTPPVPKELRRYTGLDHIRSHRPVYEPLWKFQAHLFDADGPDRHRVDCALRGRESELRMHSRSVHGGTLRKVFYSSYEIDAELKAMPQFLYAEDCPT